MGKTKDKAAIPAYQMERSGFYLLLRVQMEKRGSKNINGVGKEFFAPETYQNGRRILAGLTKRDLVTEQEGNVLVREGLEKALDRIIASPHCMNFQNAFLRKKEQILTFYYADDAYVGVLLDKKNTMVVVTPEEDALYKAFEKQLEDKAVSRDFRPDHWNVLWRGEDTSEENRGILQPLREARITHCGNRRREREFLQDTVKNFIKDHGYDVKEEVDNLQDFLSTNGFYHAGGEGTADVSAGGTMGNGGVTGAGSAGGMAGNGGASDAGGMAGNGGVMDAGVGVDVESEQSVDIGATEEETADLEVDTFLDNLGTLPNEELKHLIEGLMQFLESRRG